MHHVSRVLRFIAFVCTVDGISAAPSEDNLRYFNVIILGPESSPYQGERDLAVSSRRLVT